MLEHECMVRFGMITGYTDVFVHIESDYILGYTISSCQRSVAFPAFSLENQAHKGLAASRENGEMREMLTLKDTLPSLYSCTIRLYTGKGLLPVGRPRTKWGFS